MIVKLFNIYYFIPIIIAFLILTGLILIFKNKSFKSKNTVVIILLFLNLTLHFMKIFFPPYSENMPTSFRSLTFENICAVSTLLFPFFYLSKKKALKDYMYYLGVLGGLAALLMPTEALNKELLTFDVIRFYTTHTILLVAPILMLTFKLHNLEYKNIWKTILLFFGTLTLIMVNEYVLSLAGLSDMSRLFDRNYRNNSFVFGPTNDFDDFVNTMFVPFVPQFLRTNYFNLNVDKFYFPVLWLVFPVIVYFTPLFLLFALPFVHKDIQSDFIAVFKSKEPKNWFK